MSVRIVAPVVVKPEIVSKNASVYVGTTPAKTKGSAPNADASSQPKVTMAKPSRTRKSRVRLVLRARINPEAAVIPAEARRAV
jgi:hypothetical protein